MKIYYAWSIRGWRDDRDLYLQIIQYMKQYGTVLTEHIADPDLNFDISDKEIFTADRGWLEESDVIVSDISQNSIGVWYELWFGESLWKPILCLFRDQEWKRPSAMVSGNDLITLEIYKTLDEAKVILDNFLA